jgi:predicted nucleotidyltransferase
MGISIPIMGTQVFDPISMTLFGKVRREVLALFYSDTDASFNVNEVIRELDLGTGAVHRELKRLAEAGILEKLKVGNQIRFKANSNCVVFSELKTLMQKTSGILQSINKALHPFREMIQFAFIYGSCAKGDMKTESDIDLMIVGDVDMVEIMTALHEPRMNLKREINASVFEPVVFAERLKQKGFIKRISAGEKVFLIGTENEFRKLG